MRAMSQQELLARLRAEIAEHKDKVRADKLDVDSLQAGYGLMHGGCDCCATKSETAPWDTEEFEDEDAVYRLWETINEDDVKELRRELRRELLRVLHETWGV